MSKGAQSRAAAARTLGRLLSGSGSLGSQQSNVDGPADAALVQEMCYGVCRYYFALQQAVDKRLTKPLRAKDRDLYALLLAGAYQIFCMRIPDHAAVNESVQATKLLKKPWAGGLVNSILRKLVDAKAEWQQSLEHGSEEVRFLHPRWLIERLKDDWPEHWQAILSANNQHPPMTLRVNVTRISPADYLQLLEKEGLSARLGRLAGSAIYLQSPCPVDKLPGFMEGLFSVQDEASQLVPGQLDLSPGLRVLDACAAPGGKTAHCLESEPLLTTLTAVDIEGSRARSIEQNLQRLQLQAEIKVADASALEDWWDGNPYQRILLDAPCSATGVIRRHPDIKILRSADDIERLADRQQVLLNGLWRCLEPGGLLLYTTCSVLRQENQDTVRQFLHQCQDAKHQAIQADWGVECELGRQLLPDPDGSDGFYFAVLKKSGLPAK